MDFHGMKRQALQSLCKKHEIPANLTNREMADRLALLLKESEKPVDKDQKCSNNLGEIHYEIDSDSKIVNQKVAKKVRFSPENETFLFVSSETESGSDHDYNPKRRLRKRKSVLNQESKKQVDLSKNIKKAEVSAKFMDNSGRVTRSRAERVVGRESEMVFSPLAGYKRGRRRVKNVDVCDKPPPIADLGDKDDRCEDAESRGGSIRWRLRSKEVVNEAGEKAENGDLAVLRKNPRSRGSKNTREVKASDGVVLLDQIHEDNAIAVEAAAKPEQILKRSKRIMTKDKGPSALSEDLGETRIGRRVSRSSWKVDEKDSALESEAGNLVVEEENQKVLQLEEPAKGSRRKSVAPQNGRVQSESLACKRTERGQPVKGSRKRSRKIDSGGVSEVEPTVGIGTKDEDLLPNGPPRRSRRNIASFNSVATAVGELRTQDNDGKKKPQREAPLDSDANIAKPPRRCSRNASKEVGGTAADGVRKDLQTKQIKEKILKEESSVTVHEPATKKPLRRSRRNVPKSNVPELADLKGRSTEKNKQSKARMEIIEEEGSFRKSSWSHEERPVIDIVRERGGSKNDSDLCHRKKVRERSNKKRKGFKEKSVESSQLGSAEISALNSDEKEVTYTTMNLVDRVSESMELECVSVFQQTQDSIAEVVDNEKENIVEEEGIENLNLDNNLEGAMEYQSCHSFNTRTESGDESLVEQISPEPVEYPSKINNVVSCGIISPASGFSPAYQEDFHGLKTEKSLMGKHINPVSDKVDDLSADNGEGNAQEDKILLELDANGNFETDQEEKIQENHLSEPSGSRESERSSEKFSNEAEKIYVLVPYDRNEEETVQENHLSELSGSCEPETEKFSNEAEKICVLVHERNGIAQVHEDATETADIGVEKVADIQVGMISSDDTTAAASSEPVPQIQDSNQLEALTTIHPEILGRSDAHHVEREKCSNNLIEVPDQTIFSEDISFSKVGGQACSNERTEEVGTMKEESEEALNNGLVPASEEVIFEVYDKDLLLGGSTLQELDQLDGQVSEEEKQEVSDGCFDNASQEIKAEYVDKTDDGIIGSLITQEAKGIDVDGYLCSSIVDLKYKKATKTHVEKSSGHENEKHAIEEVELGSLPDKLQEGKECESPGALNGIVSADCYREASYDIQIELQMNQVKFDDLHTDKVAASELIESASCVDHLMPMDGADNIEDNVEKVDGALNFKDHCLKTGKKDDLDNAKEVNLEIMGDHLVDEGETDVNDIGHGDKLNHAHEDIRAATALAAEADAEEIDGKNVPKNIEDDTKWDDENSAEVKPSVDASCDKLETCSSGAVGLVLNVSSLEDKVTTESNSRSYKDNEDLSDATAEMDVDNNVTCQEFAEEILDDLKSAVKDAASENAHEGMILSRCLCVSGSEINAEQTNEALGSPAPGEVTVTDLDEVRVFKNLPVLSLVEPKLDVHFSSSPASATANLDNRASEFHVESEMFTTWEMNVILGDGEEDKGERINQSMEAIGKSEHQEKHVKVEENLMKFENFEQGISEMQFSKCEHHSSPAVSDKLISGECVSSNEQNDVTTVIQENTDCETSMEEQSFYKYPFTSMHEAGTKEGAEINSYSPASVEETKAERIEEPVREEMSKNGKDREEHVITNKVPEMKEAENGAPMLPFESMGDDTFSKYEIELSKTKGLALGASDVAMSTEYEDGGAPNEIVETVSQVGEFKFGISEKQGEVLPDLDRSASIYAESCLSYDGKNANKEENVGKAVVDPKAQVMSFDSETKDNVDGIPEDDVNDHLVEKELIEQNDNGPDLTLHNAHESSIYATDEGGDDVLDRRISIQNVEDDTKLDEELIAPFRLNNVWLSDEKQSAFVKSSSVTPSDRNVPGSSRATFSMQNFSLSCELNAGKDYECHAYSNCVRNNAGGIEMANEEKGFGHEKENPPVQGEIELGIEKRVEGQNSNEGTNNSTDGFAVENDARTSQQVVPEKLDGYTNVLKLASPMDSNGDLDLNNLFDSNSANRKRNSNETGEEIDLHDLENVAISSGQSNDFLDFGNTASILMPEMNVECSTVSPVTASRTENKALEIDAELAFFTSYELNLFSEDRERDEFEEVDTRTLKDKLINETNEEVNDGRETVLSSEKIVKEKHCDHEESMVEEVIMLKHIQLVAADEPNLIDETNEMSEGREIVGCIVSNLELNEGTEIGESIGKECDDEHGMVEELAIGKHNQLSTSDDPICENGSIPKEKGGVPVINQGLVDCEIHKFESVDLEATEIYSNNFAALDKPRAECCASDSKNPENHVNSAVEAVASENPQKLESHEDKSPVAKLLESISRSAMLKRKTNKNFSIPTTPKNLHKIHDMKENFPTSKREQVNNMTQTKTSVKRRALEDLQKN